MNLLVVRKVCNIKLLTRITPTQQHSFEFLSHDDNKGIEDNPFYSKYQKQLEKFKMHPNDRVSRKISHPLQKNSKIDDTKLQPKQPLDSILDISKLHNKTSEEISNIWNTFHSNLDCIHGTIPADAYTLMSTQGTLCPYFIYPLPSETGYRFMFQHFSNNEFHFTSLEDYNLLKEHSPTYLTLSYYSELANDKGIVLMAGKFDFEKLKPEESQLLAHLLQLYYGQNNQERIDLIRKFNFTPDLFDFQQLIRQIKELMM